MHTETVPDRTLHHEAAVAADSRALAEEPAEAPIQPAGRAPAEVQLEAASTTVTQTREAINLRVLLELRRRLKSAAEKELAALSPSFACAPARSRPAPSSSPRPQAASRKPRPRPLTPAPVSPPSSTSMPIWPSSSPPRRATPQASSSR
jgi:hypothetical protein